MAIAAAFRPSFNPVLKILTRQPEARRKKLDEANEIKAVYRDVDERDGRKCRSCGRRTTTKPSLDAWHTHNHLVPRSLADKAIKHTTRNVHVCCNRCNQLLKLQKIRFVGTNCDAALAFFWTALATKKEREGLTLQDERKAA